LNDKVEKPKNITDGLISECFSVWLKVPNHSPEHLLFRWIVFWRVIWHLFVGDLSQSEKLSEIEPPLELDKSEQD
jgi:hypothetical protein